jgi:hypothetical protein
MQPKASAISADAVAMVQLEIQAYASDSTIFDTVITTVESTLQANKIISCNHCTQDLSSSSFSSSSSYSVSLSCTECSSQTELALSSANSTEKISAVFTSPLMKQRTKPNKKYSSRKESDKGGKKSHKASDPTLQLTARQMINENPTAQSFLYQHGHSDVFSGCIALERRYIRNIVLGISEKRDISDVDIKLLNRDVLQKVRSTVCNFSIFFNLTVELI